MSNKRLQCLGEFGGLEVRRRHVVHEQRSRRQHRRQRGDCRQSRSQHRVDPPEADVPRGETLIGNRALLKKQHPRRDCRSDIGQQDQNRLLREPTGQWPPTHQCAANRAPVRMAQQRHRHKHQVEHGSA